MYSYSVHPLVRDAPIKQPVDNPDSSREEEITFFYLDFYLFYQSNLNVLERGDERQRKTSKLNMSQDFVCV